MFWWISALILVTVFVVLVVVENRRGSVGKAKEDDRRLNRPDGRGGSSGTPGAMGSVGGPG